MRVNISPMARVYGTLKTGKNCRIDDFVIITGDVTLGDHVHIGCFCFLSGGEGIIIGDYVGLSPRTSLFTASDDYSGKSLTNPIIPDKYKPWIQRGPIVICRHALIGAHTVVLPGVEVGEGCAVGAQSLVNRSLQPWWIYAGTPVRPLCERYRDSLELEKEFEANYAEEACNE